jgi:cysteinyl-tRNA synthetase
VKLTLDHTVLTKQNFFMNVKARLAEAGPTANADAANGLSSTEDKTSLDLTAKLEQAKKDLDLAFCNSFDTLTATQVISRLVRDGNIYMGGADVNLPAVETVARWVTRVVGILGLDQSAKPPYEGIGWSSGATVATNGDPKIVVDPFATVFATVVEEIRTLNLSDASLPKLLDQQSPKADFEALEKHGEKDFEKLALPYIRAVSRLRDELRRLVSSNSLDKSSKAAILMIADRIRDYDLADLGVQLDDQVDKPSLVKFVPAARLVAAREEKAAMVAEKALQKERGMYFSSCCFQSPPLSCECIC